jgi:5,10-methylenetetrahydromethanopterin reductase
MTGRPDRPFGIGIRFPPCERVDRLAEAVAEAERLGFDRVWMPDSQLLWRDVYASLLAAAMRTEHIGLGIGVTNFVTRHVSVTASACRTLEEVAPGRVVVGVGSGFSAVQPVGLPASTQAELAEGIAALRALLAGDEWAFGDQQARLVEPGGPTPILLAAGGPKALALAGAVADGVIALTAADVGRLRANLDRVRAGAEAAGRRFEDLEVVVTAFCHVTDDPERDLRLWKPICLGMAQLGNQAMLAGCGIDLPDPGHLPGVFPDMLHADDWDEAIGIAEDFVTDEMAGLFAERACIYGTADTVTAQIAAIAEAGVTSLFFQGIGSYELPFDLMERVAAGVLPAFAKED